MPTVTINRKTGISVYRTNSGKIVSPKRGRHLFNVKQALKIARSPAMKRMPFSEALKRAWKIVKAM